MRYIENIDREWAADPDPDGLRQAIELRTSEPERSLECFNRLAKNGSSLAMLYIGNAYANGRGVDRDIDLGIKWYKAAAEHGSVEAAHRLAFCYYHMGMYGRSIEILRELSDKGFLPATYCLGLFYFYGVGVDKSLDSAVKLWEYAEKRGHLLSARRLSFLLRSGALGVFGIVRGFVKMVLMTIPYTKLVVKNSRSDLLREW